MHDDDFYRERAAVVEPPMARATLTDDLWKARTENELAHTHVRRTGVCICAGEKGKNRRKAGEDRVNEWKGFEKMEYDEGNKMAQELEVKDEDIGKIYGTI